MDELGIFSTLFKFIYSNSSEVMPLKSIVGLTSVSDVRPKLKYNGEISSESNVKSLSQPKFNF